eukprot:scaffold20628_cov112-Isochrysis_galbana.AAC.4
MLLVVRVKRMRMRARQKGSSVAAGQRLKFSRGKTEHVRSRQALLCLTPGAPTCQRALARAAVG